MLPHQGRPGREREYAGGSVGGILRKPGNAPSASGIPALRAGEARQVELLVFGYAAKVFRDDEKAILIDQGKHLIPWMGDNNLKIDRYDVRSAMYELAPYEPPPGGYGNRLDYLSADEQRAEQLCEEERYLYLYNNETELILQQEEDLKRLQQESTAGPYKQVGFDYDASVGVQHGPNREELTENDDTEEAFKLPANFDVPADIRLPDSMKQHAIIEKTARFIASQGVQMEILLKAKQSNNVQFEFLAANSLINPYYKFVMNAMKNGTYPAPGAFRSRDSDENTPTTPDNGGLFDPFAAASQKPVITVPMVKYKPSANCAYTQLISKIKGLPLPAMLDENSSSASGTSSPGIINTPTPVLLQYNGNTFVTESAAEITAADDQNSNSNSNAPSCNISADSTPRVELLKNASVLALAQDYASDTEDEEEIAEGQTSVEPVVAEPEPALTFPVPTLNLKNIIDKTATYVIKNGRQFEETLRTKSVERFMFLSADNEHYPYYMYKITGDPDAASKEAKTKKAAAVAAALLSKKGLNTVDKTMSPVSFSIKAKEENASAALQQVLPQETSDDEDQLPQQRAGDPSRAVPEHVAKAIQLVEIQLMARNAQLSGGNAAGSAVGAAVGSAVGAAVGAAVSSATGPTPTPLPTAARPAATTASSAAASTTRSRFDIDYNGAIALLNANSSSAPKLLSKSGNITEQARHNALFEQQQQQRQKELKKAEEKVKDKLAQIAREKLGGLLSKEKQLQLERKRKALAFLNQIKGTPAGTPSTAVDEVEVAAKGEHPVEDPNAESADSSSSVHSIPITSYGPAGKSDDEAETPYQVYPQLGTTTVAHRLPAHRPNSATVTLSDDDDVQLISESKPSALMRREVRTSKTALRKRRSSSSARTESKRNSHRRSKRSRRQNSESNSYSSSESSYSDESYGRVSERRRCHRSSSKVKSSSTHSKSKKKSKKRSRSSNRRRSKSRKYSRSHSTDDEPRKRHGQERYRKSRSRDKQSRGSSHSGNSRRKESRRHHDDC